MFSIAKIIFNNNKKKFRPKDSNRQHCGHQLCTLPLRCWRFDITRHSAWYHLFAAATDIFSNFFRRKAGALKKKKKYMSNEIN
jgi:hypothetical protein